MEEYKKQALKKGFEALLKIARTAARAGYIGHTNMSDKEVEIKGNAIHVPDLEYSACTTVVNFDEARENRASAEDHFVSMRKEVAYRVSRITM